MAAPPPPPPPPPAPAPIAKPNNNKLLESIRQGTGLKKVPESAKNDRSTVIAPISKSGGNASAMPLPSGLKGSSGAPMSIADAIKARADSKLKGNSGSTAQQKRCDVPAPNQNVGQTSNIPKPPDQTSKPSINNTQTFPPPPPPMPTGAASKPFAPPPALQGIQNKPFAPPPMAPMAPPPMAMGTTNRPFAPPPLSQDNTDKPFAPPPMNPNRPLAPPMIQNNKANVAAPSPPPPPPPPPPQSLPLTSDIKPSIPPPVFHSMKPTTQEAYPPPMALPPQIRLINNSNGSIKNTPPMFAPPPPPPTSSMPTKLMSSIQIGKPAPNRPPQVNSDVLSNKPSQPVRNDMQNTFDSRFTFLDESLFPSPQTVVKRPKAVV